MFFKVVLFSSGSPTDIRKLSRRINREVPEARVSGILWEWRPGKNLTKRVSAFLSKLNDKDFIDYSAGKIAASMAKSAGKVGSAALRFVHATTPVTRSEENLEAICRELDCEFLVTSDFHNEASLEFVRRLNPDLGIVYGTRILKPALFAIPRLGSINIHKRKLPDYRGGGPVGLWEMLDGQKQIGVTVHEVVEKLDAGAIINSQTIPIDPFDSLTSLALKAHVIGNDLIVKSVADYARDAVERRPQDGPSRMFKNPSPHQLARYEKQLARTRPAFRPLRGRSKAKLLLRSVAGLPIVAPRNWLWKLRGKCPVMILFHHIVTDRPHRLGMPTDHFIKHIELLQKHYRIVSLSDAIEMLRANIVKEPVVVLTFDDGYRDNYLTLRAIRERFDVPMTLFVSTACIGRDSGFSHDIEQGVGDFLPLTWEQLVQMKKEGFEIGSHTRSHFDCGSRNRQILQQEIVGSKQDLEQRVGPVELFSFPFGLPENISAEAMDIAAKNYQYIFSAYGGANFAPPQSGVKHLRRWPHPNDLWETELMLQSLLEAAPPLEVLRRVLERVDPDPRAA